MIQILVVEDEAMVRENIVEILRGEGYATLEARDGEEGLRIAVEKQPDLILCDVRMPRLDGFGMLAQFSQDPAGSHIPFIFLTARTERSDQRTGMSLGADDYITKPFTRYDLLMSVRRRLEKRQALTELAERKSMELHGRILRGVPYELLAPSGILLGHANILMKADWIASNPAQVRAMAREIHHAATRMVNLLQQFLLYQDLEQDLDPERQAQMAQQITPDCGSLLTELARSVALGYGRESDLRFGLEEMTLRLPETFFQSLLEEFIDRAFRNSVPGSVVEIQGRRIADGYYQVSIRDGAGRLPGEHYSSNSLAPEDENRPVGLLLADRIITRMGGRMRIDAGIDYNLVELDLPVAYRPAD